MLTIIWNNFKMNLCIMWNRISPYVSANQNSWNVLNDCARSFFCSIEFIHVMVVRFLPDFSVKKTAVRTSALIYSIEKNPAKNRTTITRINSPSYAFWEILWSINKDLLFQILENLNETLFWVTITVIL